MLCGTAFQVLLCLGVAAAFVGRYGKPQILHGSLRPVIAPQKMFIICADLVFWFVGLLSAQVCGIEAGLMAGNVAVADKAGDSGRG